MLQIKNNNNKDRRLFQRFTKRLPVRFIDLEKNTEGTGYTCDVSAKGLGLVVSRQIDTFTPLEIWLEIPDGGLPLYSRGQVVWSRPLIEGSYRVGINLERADLMGVSRILRLG